MQVNFASDYDKFVRFMRLAISPRDGVALAAIRKASNLLTRNNLTWEDGFFDVVWCMRERADGAARSGSATPGEHAAAHPPRPLRLTKQGDLT